MLVRKIPPTDPTRIAYLHAVAGNGKKALEILESYDLPWHVFSLLDGVRIQCVLGDKDAALKWLERAVEKGLRHLVRTAPDPDLAILKDDPCYEALLARMKAKCTDTGSRSTDK